YAPEIQVPRRVFEESEIKMIMDAAKPNLRMLIALCFYAGLRKNEAIRLRWSDVDFTRNRISVWPPEGRVSSKHKFREVFLEPELSQMIKERGYCETVVRHITGDRAWIDLHAAIKKTQIANAEGLNFQLMRSSRENIWFARGIPPNVVTSWLGHTAQIAAKHYRGVPESYYKTAQNEISKDEQISQLMSQVKILTQQINSK
ncbi:XerC Integrase, partial [uncultured Caudovirales phage]